MAMLFRVFAWAAYSLGIVLALFSYSIGLNASERSVPIIGMCLYLAAGGVVGSIFLAVSSAFERADRHGRREP